MSMLFTILGISLLIILHEAGHYLAARTFKMRIMRFSIGFGPALFKIQRGETLWQFAAIPFGGFVQIHGMGPVDPESKEPPLDERSFRNNAVWKRLIVIGAGPAMNWLLAAFFIFLLSFTVGFSRYDETSARIGQLSAEGAGAIGGLQDGDLIQAIAGVKTTTWNDLVKEVRAHPNEEVEFLIQRDTREMSILVTPKAHPEKGHGLIGAAPWAEIVKLGFGASILAGFKGAAIFTAQQTNIIWGLLRGTQEGQLSGIPGIIKMVSTQAEQGLRRFLEALAWLSIGLFVLNILPVPALDGSRLVFLSIEGVRRRPVNEQVEGWVHGIGFLLLMGLMIFVSIRDLL